MWASAPTDEIDKSESAVSNKTGAPFVGAPAGNLTDQSQSRFFSVLGSKKCMTLPSKVMFSFAP